LKPVVGQFAICLRPEPAPNRPRKPGTGSTIAKPKVTKLAKNDINKQRLVGERTSTDELPVPFGKVVRQPRTWLSYRARETMMDFLLAVKPLEKL
jgi:hypothetical protein